MCVITSRRSCGNFKTSAAASKRVRTISNKLFVSFTIASPLISAKKAGLRFTELACTCSCTPASKNAWSLLEKPHESMSQRPRRCRKPGPSPSFPVSRRFFLAAGLHPTSPFRSRPAIPGELNATGRREIRPGIVEPAIASKYPLACVARRLLGRSCL